MNLERSYLNFKALSIPTQWQLTKAKRAYLKEHNKCAICGTNEDLEVHHIVPVHIDSRQALDPTNFITLCDWRNHGCHYVFGHFRNFKTKWNPNIREVAAAICKILNETRESSFTEMIAVTAWNASRKRKI